MENKKEEDLEGKDRYYISKGYLLEVDKGYYQLYRDMLVDEYNESTNTYKPPQVVKERLPIGKLLIESTNPKEDKIVLTTTEPITNRILYLKEFTQ